MNGAAGRYGNARYTAGAEAPASTEVTRHYEHATPTHGVNPPARTQAEEALSHGEVDAHPVTTTADLDHVGGQTRISARLEDALRERAEVDRLEILKALDAGQCPPVAIDRGAGVPVHGPPAEQKQTPWLLWGVGLGLAAFAYYRMRGGAGGSPAPAGPPPPPPAPAAAE